MKSLAKILAFGLVATSLAGGAVVSSADAKGFRGHGHGYGFGHKSGGHRFGAHKFHFGQRFGYGYDHCWKFGRWVCGPRNR